MSEIGALFLVVMGLMERGGGGEEDMMLLTLFGSRDELLQRRTHLSTYPPANCAIGGDNQ